MSKFSQHASITLIITLLISFSGHIYEAHASEIKVWKKISTQIMEDEFFYEREYCFGTEIESLALNEGHFIYENYAHHPACGYQYDLHGMISFDSPPPKVIAEKEIIHLHAEGNMSGYQSCCFLEQWFTYDRSDCFSAPFEQVYLSLRSSGEPHEITIPDTEYAIGWDTPVSDAMDIYVSMPEKAVGSECSVVGRGNRGLWLKWVYKMEVEQVSDVVISDILGDEVIQECKSTEVKDYIIILKNNGSIADTGTIKLSTNLTGATFVKNSIPYSLTGSEIKPYQFGMIFPPSMHPMKGNIIASIDSDVGMNLSSMKFDIEVKCGVVANFGFFLLYYLGGQSGLPAP